ncbi:MAG: P1 family peptidase [Acidimicrobiales bacterium]
MVLGDAFLSGVLAGPMNGIADLPGVRVGHYDRDDDGFLTGTTVVLFDEPTRAGVSVGGGGPGTRETDALAPTTLVEYIHGITLSGGSAYGLSAADGVMEYLEMQGVGHLVGTEPRHVVPIVPTAIIFDLGRGGNFGARPDPSFGRNAAERAIPDQMRWGSVGVGRGARCHGRPSGIGTASFRLPDGSTIAAVVVCNALGDIRSPSGELYAAEDEVDNEFARYLHALPDIEFSEEIASPLNTTLAIIATDVPLSRAECTTMARIAHDGLARAIRPVHTYFDGDVVFATSTTTDELPSPAAQEDIAARRVALAGLMELGARAVARATVHAVGKAQQGSGTA